MKTKRAIIADDHQAVQEIARLVRTARDEGCQDVQRRGRVHPRFRAGLRFELTNQPTVTDVAWGVTLNDISNGGFAAWSKREVRVGTDIWIREFSSANSRPWITARITSCTSGILGFRVGAQFQLQPLSG